VIGGGIHKICILLGQQLCQLFIQLTRFTWSIYQAISMPGRCILQVVLFKKISIVHLKFMPVWFFGSSHVTQKVRNIQRRHGILPLELCGPHSGTLTLLVPAWSRIVLMDSIDHAILFWQPGLGILQNKSWLLKAHMAHTRCVKFLTVRRWAIPLFDHSITQEISIFTHSV